MSLTQQLPSKTPTLRLESTPVRSPAGHARPFEETAAWIEPVLERVPITRVHNAGSLGTVSMPVYIAVTPLARDLTVHAGKGTSGEAARLSAVMEAIERVSAESLPGPDPIRASFRDLRDASVNADVVDPLRFDLPFDSVFDDDRVIGWARAIELGSEREALVAADLAISPGRDGVTHGVETNGLAAGNTFTEAIVHALYEVTERDAYSVDTFYLLHHDAVSSPARPLRVIAHDDVPSEAASWLERLHDRNLRVVLRDLTSDVGVTVILVTIIDESFPGAERDLITVAGLGADLDAGRALMRAITEAVQSHTATLLAARDTFAGLRRVPEREAMLYRRIDSLFAAPSVAFTELERHDSVDLCENARLMLARLREAGHEHCYAVDLSQERLGVPVVRVLVPGLAMPYGDSPRRPTRRLLHSVLAGGCP